MALYASDARPAPIPSALWGDNLPPYRANPSMRDDIPTIRLHLWLESRQGVYFGLGRAILLAKIEEHGSLKRAAGELGMSYRAAWGKIKRSEEVLGVKLIVQVGTKREGYRLTDTGRMMMEQFFQWYEEVERDALKRARNTLPWTVQTYTSTEQR